MEKLTQESKKIMDERFGRDNVVALATVKDGVPWVRNVNAFYQDGCFYIITHALSNKMKQLAANPAAAIAGDWFTARGKGINLGWFGKPENKDIAGRLKMAFSTWIHIGHNDFSSENTCILCIQLTEGVLFSHGSKYVIDFTKG